MITDPYKSQTETMDLFSGTNIYFKYKQEVEVVVDENLVLSKELLKVTLPQ